MSDNIPAEHLVQKVSCLTCRSFLGRKELSHLATRCLFMEHKEKKPDGRKLAGRPVLESGKRIRKIDARFTEEEYQLIRDMEKTLGLKKTDIVRMRVLGSASSQLLNAKDLIAALDGVGAELGKSGSNINQLARYANILQKRGMLSVQVLDHFNLLFEKYLSNQQMLELTLRKIMRAMSK